MTDLPTLLKPHDKTLETLVDTAAKQDQAGFLAATGRLLADVATELPVVGKLVHTGLDKVFGLSAWKQMERALADAKTEDERRARLADMAGVFAALLGQAMATLVDHQDAQFTALLESVGGLRDELETFREDVERAAAPSAATIDLQDVHGLGFEVGPDAGRSVFIKTQIVRPGAIGFKI